MHYDFGVHGECHGYWRIIMRWGTMCDFFGPIVLIWIVGVAPMCCISAELVQ